MKKRRNRIKDLIRVNYLPDELKLTQQKSYQRFGIKLDLFFLVNEFPRGLETLNCSATLLD